MQANLLPAMFSCLALSAASGFSQVAAKQDFVTDRIVVRFSGHTVPYNTPVFGPVTGLKGVDTVSAKWHSSQALSLSPTGFRNGELAEKLGLDRVFVYHVPEGTDVKAMAAEFAAAKGVEEAHVDGKVYSLLTPNDSLISNCWPLNNTGQTGGTPDADIDAFEAWDIHTGGTQAVLAVLDTGIQASHPEFSGRLLSGWNTLSNNTNTNDGFGHGTHCSGIAAANGNNNQGVAGVSWGTRIMPVKCLDDGGGGTWTSVAQAIIWAADHGAWVESMSLGGSGGSSEAQNAVDYAFGNGVLLIAAAGNTGSRNVLYPAAYANCYAVSATTMTDAFASFSSYGPQVDVSAPGDTVYSTYPTNSYAWLSGTSMACPHVSGLAVLLWSLDRSLTRDELWNVIITTCDDKGPVGWDEKFGWGRINAFTAMQKVAAPLVYPNSMSFYHCTQSGGNLNSLKYSDDDRVSFTLVPSQATGDPFMGLIIDGTSPNLSPSRIDMIAEEQTSEIVFRRVDMWNWNTSQWEVMNSRQANSNDQWSSVTVTSNPSRFVRQSDGAMRARIVFIDPSPAASPLQGRVDQFRWAVRN